MTNNSTPTAGPLIDPCSISLNTIIRPLCVCYKTEYTLIIITK